MFKFSYNLHFYIQSIMVVPINSNFCRMSSSLMPHKFSFMKEKLEDETYHCNISWSDILIWIQHKHYPVVTLSCERDTHSTEFFLSLSYNTTNYINWLIPINLREISLNEDFKTCLPHINNIRLIFPQSDWMVNIQQAGKYMYKILHVLCNYKNSKRYFCKYLHIKSDIRRSTIIMKVCMMSVLNI